MAAASVPVRARTTSPILSPGRLRRSWPSLFYREELDATPTATGSPRAISRIAHILPTVLTRSAFMSFSVSHDALSLLAWALSVWDGDGWQRHPPDTATGHTHATHSRAVD